MPPETKKVVIAGRGPYLGMLITEGTKNVKGATWYDRSKQANEAIEVERKLVEAGHVKDSALKPRGAKSGGNERDCDVLVTVSMDKIVIEKKPKGPKKTLSTKRVEKMNDLNKICSEFVKTVQKLLKD